MRDAHQAGDECGLVGLERFVFCFLGLLRPLSLLHLQPDNPRHERALHAQTQTQRRRWHREVQFALPEPSQALSLALRAGEAIAQGPPFVQLLLQLHQRTPRVSFLLSQALQLAGETRLPRESKWGRVMGKC
jgi:hypothetical protein